MKLNKVIHNHKGKLWCGIAALSAITGNPTDHSKQCIRLAIDDILKRTGRTIKGIYTDEIIAALGYLCIDHKLIYSKFNNKDQQIFVSLARFLHGYKPNPGKLYLVVIPGHFLVTDGTTITDNVHPNGISLFNYMLLDQEVMRIYELSDNTLNNL